MTTPVIVWFRRNLRLIDNTPLIAAVESGRPVLALYVHDDMDFGGASNWWLHHSLVSLDAALSECGGNLHIRAGAPPKLIAAFAEECGAVGVYYSRRYEPEARQQERLLQELLPDDVDLNGYDDGLLNPPDAVQTQTGNPYKVFTPYWKASVQLGDPDEPRPAPDTIRFADPVRDSGAIEKLGLLPSNPDWSQGLRNTWQPGEVGALNQLDIAVNNAAGYDRIRDRPDLDLTSRMSPFLHFGEVSVRQVWHAIKAGASQASRGAGSEALLRQLFWRDFSGYLLFHFPRLPEQPLRAEFEHFPWSNDRNLLRAWQQGKTGYPLVDAGMRQLWKTGWMHNRVRMIVASFLVKNLMIDWQTGAGWFLDTLVDADLANNSAGWQWVAGCGTDAAPYFRIFNPVLQSAKFDPDGNYIRRWVPELSDLPAKHIHEPWKADDKTLRSANVEIDVDYPAPIVDLGETRQRALGAYQVVRGLLQSAAEPR